MRIRTLALVVLINLILVDKANSQLFINEISASNSTIIKDPQFNNFADWIEIYNSGQQDINLNGYFLTDNIENADKWQINISTIIPAKGFVIIWADGENIDLHTSFKLAQEGESIALYSPSGELIDSISFLSQLVDISYGRQTNGNTDWAYFLEPTPGSDNNTVPYLGFVLNVPEFSVLGGIFEEPQSLELSTVMDGTIMYTTDGSDPMPNSQIYSQPIQIDNTTVIRARVFKSGMIPGKIITNSYFINEDLKTRNLPVVSLSTNPDNFWDSESGIYVQDFKPEWEVPVNIELFENNGSDRAAFNLQAGTKVNGLYSWQLPQKMLGVYFRKQYGETALDYNLFFDKSRTGFEDFALRASGSDWSYTMFRDILGHHSTLLNMDLDIMDFRPSVVFVNGQYMGIHNIREKVDENYVVGNYGLAEGTFDIVENEDFAEAGSLDEYNTFKNLYSKDLSVQSNFDAVANAIDIKNFTDLVITEMSVSNTSIDHNVMAWKPKGTGKWRWILMDLDRGFFNTGLEIDFYISQDVWPFGQLMENEGYRKYFGQRLADHLFTSYHPTQMNKLIDGHKNLIEAEIPYHVERWLGTTSNYGDAMPSVSYWYDQVEALRSFVNARPQNVLSDLTNYGFDSYSDLSLNVFPSNAGFLTIDSLRVPGPIWQGPYPDNLEINLKAFNRPGFKFVRWVDNISKQIIEKGTSWKYLDNGNNEGTSWQAESFNDDAWKTGNAELGYGEGDENTVISYGGSSSNKYITYYFRKSFEISAADLQATSIVLNLLCDDGAVVYLNGTEIIRSNMPSGEIDYLTRAIEAVDGAGESQFLSWQLNSSDFKTGLNTIAVEVHQITASSSDISFDLELLAEIPNAQSLVSENPEIKVTHSNTTNLTAIYEASGECLLPDTIRENTTLDLSCSPYLAQGDIYIPGDIVLTIDPGVEIQMPENACIFVHGKMIANGIESQRITFKLNPEYAGNNWGALCFIETSDTSKLSWVTIEDASNGPGIINAVAAISAFKAKLYLDHILIEKVARNPVTARYSDVVIKNSFLHSDITGDLINMKYGKAWTENCELVGNKMPDTDAIDYDNITDGIIRNCNIHSFFGFNSDAIDVGEKATNILIDSNFIFDITDKGISVGQHSTTIVKNNTFINCNLGLGLKDSCNVFVNHCTFFNVGIPVACFEKNPGSAGGNASVRNSILSNSFEKSIFVDAQSKLSITQSISDNDTLQAGNNNLFGNPYFENPVIHNLQLKNQSPCINAAVDENFESNLGSLVLNFPIPTSVQFSGIFYNTVGQSGQSEFLVINNPSDSAKDISGFTLSGGVSFTFPEQVVINPGENIYITKDIRNPPASFYPGTVFEWESGNLANEGESILISDNYGIVRDRVKYSPLAPWPILNDSAQVLILVSNDVDNHFGENWITNNYYNIIRNPNDSQKDEIFVYPNPVSEIAYIDAIGLANAGYKIYTIDGKLVLQSVLNQNGFASIDISMFENGIYILKIGNNSRKILVIH